MPHLPKEINLHAIRDEIRKVKEALAVVRPHSSLAKREDIDLKLQQLDELEKATKRICPRAYGVWSEDEVEAGRPQAAAH